jgi:MFS family permease
VLQRGSNWPRDLKVAILAHALLRIAGSAGGVVVGVWLAALSRQGLPIHANLVGTLAASAFGAELVSSVPLGVAADAVSVRWLMSTGALLGALAMLLFGLTALIPVFFLSRLLEGVAAAAVTPPLLRFLASSTAHDAMRRARMMSWFELSLLAGLALGGLVGTQLWSWQQRGAFNSLALLYGLSGRCCSSAPGKRSARAARRPYRASGARSAIPWCADLRPSGCASMPSLDYGSGRH